MGAAVAMYVVASPELGDALFGPAPAAARERAPKKSREPAPDPRVRSREAAAKAILGQDPFCPDCVEAPAAAPAENPPARFAPYGKDATLGPLLHPGESATTLPLRLVATMEAERPRHSLATIRHETRGVGVFARGDEIMPDVEIVGVGHGIVHLRNHETVEYLALQPPSAKRPAKKKKKKKAKSKGKKKKNKYAIEGADDAIECAKGHRCKIDRAFVEKLIRSPALLAGQGRVRLYKKGGEALGYRLSRARRGTVPYLLGLRSGDVLTAINGNSLDGPDAAMGMYAKLRRASHLDVTVLRKGKTLKMSIEIG